MHHNNIQPEEALFNPKTQPIMTANDQLSKQQTDQTSPLKQSPTKQECLPLQSKQLYTDEEMRHFRIQGIKSIIGGVLLHLELGTFYVWGSISPYVAAYMRQYDESVTLDFMSIVFPILGLITMSVLSFGIKIAEKVGFKTTMLIGSQLIALAFLIISFVKDIYGLIVIYCLLVGVSGGLLYMLPIVCGWRYFPDHRGLVSGMIIGGYGFGSFIFNFVCKAIANPDNLKPTVKHLEGDKIVKYFDLTVGDQVPLMFQVLAACYCALGLVGTLLIRLPVEIDPEIMAATLIERNRLAGKKALLILLPAHKECQTIKRGVLSKPFAILMPLVLLSCTLGMLISNCYKLYGLELEIDDATLTATGSVAGVMNGCSRFFWATLTDKTSFKFTFTLISIINLITAAILPYNTSGIGYLLLIALVYLSEGGLVATYPVICAKIYGKKVGSLMYGFLFFMIGVCNMLGYVLYAFARKSSFGWQGVFWFCFAMNVVGIALGLILKEVDYDWRSPEDQASDNENIENKTAKIEAGAEIEIQPIQQNDEQQ